MIKFWKYHSSELRERERLLLHLGTKSFDLVAHIHVLDDINLQSQLQSILESCTYNLIAAARASYSFQFGGQLAMHSGSPQA